MLVRFTKMHGIGNDFVVLDLISQRYRPQVEHMRHIADRHFGIGCDQILIIEPPESSHNDFRYRIFNADGSEVEQCGNGARCFARYVYDKGLTGKKSISVETCHGEMMLHLKENGNVRVDMGPPIFEPKAIPLNAQRQEKQYSLPLTHQTITVGVLSMGNPHAVYRVDDINSDNIKSLGPQLESHTDFPNKTNAGFMQIIHRQHIKLRVYERGAGETLACGSGACAAVVHGINMGWLDHTVNVELPGGNLRIEWQGNNSHVQLIGPTCYVYEGSIQL